MNIICMGDALIDFKEDNDPLSFKGFVGGSPLNVAVAVARLGESAGFASQISSDQFGQAIRTHLQKNGVDTSFLLESDAPSTLAFVGEVEGEAVFDFIANRSADVLYDPQPRQDFGEVKMVQFGSISLLQEPAATTLTETAAKHKGSATIVFDPNVRPALISDRKAFETRLRRDWLPISHVVKVSSQDLRWLYPDTPHDEVAKRWLEHGSEVVIITDGGEGVTLYRSGQDELRVPSFEVEVVDTVGAGDTFTGALMVSLLEHSALETLEDEGWREVLRTATAASAFNCTHAGANPPSKEELEGFLLEHT